MINEAKRLSSTVATPAAGTLTLFVDENGVWSVKDSSAVVTALFNSTPASYMRGYVLKHMALATVDAVPGWVEILDISENVITTAPVLSGATALKRLIISNNLLNETNVNAVLVALAALSVSNGYLDITSNVPPGAAGLTAKTTLEGRGWTVLVDS